MSKVLVDRELLEKIIRLWDCGLHCGAEISDLRTSLRAQPAEAEGVEVVATVHIGDPCPETGAHDDLELLPEDCEFYDGECLVRQDDHLAALSAVTAERDRLRSKWSRVESERDRLLAEVGALRKDAERWRYVRLQGDDTHWLNLLRVDLDEFGGNINAAVDALIDGEAPAMDAKEA